MAEAEAVGLRERSAIGLKAGSFRALQRPLLFQPDALASGFELLSCHIAEVEAVGLRERSPIGLNLGSESFALSA
jgi:hypothetical protein